MAFDQLGDISDDALLVLYANGDRDAARVLTERLAPRVLGFANRMLHDLAEAEDVTQEAMLRLWKIAHDWQQGQAKVSTWLFRVAYNLATDRLRKRRTLGGEEVPDVEDETPGVESRMIYADRAAALNAAIDQLPARQKEAVILRHIEGLSNPEIAKILQVSTEAVESLTARAKGRLTKILTRQKEELGL